MTLKELKDMTSTHLNIASQILREGETNINLLNDCMVLIKGLLEFKELQTPQLHRRPFPCTDEELNSQTEGIEWEDETRFLEHISQFAAADTNLLEFMSQIGEDPIALYVGPL